VTFFDNSTNTPTRTVGRDGRDNRAATERTQNPSRPLGPTCLAGKHLRLPASASGGASAAKTNPPSGRVPRAVCLPVSSPADKPPYVFSVPRSGSFLPRALSAGRGRLKIRFNLEGLARRWYNTRTLSEA
jgi:hypothetical protein